MLNEQQIFDKVAKSEFCWMPVRRRAFTPTDEEKDRAEVAYIDRMDVYYNTLYVDAALEQSPLTALLYLLGIFRHEMAHLSEFGAPITIRNAIDFAKMVGKQVLKDSQYIAVHQFNNMVSDVIVDVRNCDMLQDRLDVTCTIAYKKFGDIDLNNKVQTFLVAYREEAMGVRFSGLEIQEPVRVTAAKAVAWARRRHELQLKDIFRGIAVDLWALLKDDIEQSGRDREQAMEQLKKMIQEAMSREGRSADVTTTQESQSADPDMSIMEQVNLEDRDEQIIIGRMLPHVGKMLDMWKLIMRAHREVRFHVKPTGISQETSFRAGNDTWRAGMPVKQLDPIVTVQKRGIIIPDCTTLKAFYAAGKGIEKEGGFPPMFCNVDVSGSMWNATNDTLVAIFAFILTAKKHKVACGFDLFADRHLHMPLTHDYQKLLETAYKDFKKPGGGNSVPGPENLPGTLPRGCLVLYVTDFHLYPDDQKGANKALHQLRAEGAQIVPIIMFDDSDRDKLDFRSHFCPKVENLSDAILSAVDM